MWETGGRIGDIINVTLKDFEGRVLNLYTKKRKKNISMEISPELYADILTFLRHFKIKEDERIFKMTVQRAWQIIKQYANDIDFPKEIKVWKSGKQVSTTLRPHLFRHGMAINLMNQGVNTAVISARLGHSNVKITQDMYMKVTTEIQALHTKGVEWR